MLIRKAKIKDLDTITDFAVSLLKKHEKFDPYYKMSKTVKSEVFKYLKRAIYSKNRVLLVAEQNGEVIGYTFAKTVSRGPFFIIQKIGFISDVYVAEKARKKGVTKLLFQELYKWFKTKNITYVELQVHEKNETAKKVWQKHGFNDYSHKRVRKI